jgi:hypothetical protein
MMSIVWFAPRDTIGSPRRRPGRLASFRAAWLVGQRLLRSVGGEVLAVRGLSSPGVADVRFSTKCFRTLSTNASLRFLRRKIAEVARARASRATEGASREDRGVRGVTMKALIQPCAPLRRDA